MLPLHTPQKEKKNETLKIQEKNLSSQSIYKQVVLTHSVVYISSLPKVISSIALERFYRYVTRKLNFPD